MYATTNAKIVKKKSNIMSFIKYVLYENEYYKFII